jgi:PAS domain S-box-containing protein
MEAFLIGYMTARENQVLEDQEQMRKALSTALAAQRRELQIKNHAIHTYVNGIMLTDLKGRITYVNPAFMKLWQYEDAEEILNSECTKFLVIGDFTELLDSLHETAGWQNDNAITGKDGKTLELVISASLIQDEGSQPIGIMVSFTDVTEWKRLEYRFRQAQKMEAINTLAGGIAHDFNNLLTTIVGNTSLMLMDINPSHPHYERLRDIEDQVESGSRLTKQLLGYARKGKYEVKPINLNRFVQETSETFGRTRKELMIHKDLEEYLAVIEADRGQIEQVLLNLYINAADAMPAGGDLTLRTRNLVVKKSKHQHTDLPQGQYVTLSVTDTGMGMDPKTAERIFDPFFTTKDMGRGVGLGLASTYGIIKNHGGRIEVQSTPGIGATFVIYLPASDKELVEDAKPEEEVVNKREAILVVDDEDLVLDISAKLLRALGYTVFEAKSGKEALGLYQSEKDKIALVILDMIMPMMGGGETFDKLKKIDPDVKVLLSSGYSIDGKATEILARGCLGFIQKPFMTRDLSEKIKGVLDKI